MNRARIASPQPASHPAQAGTATSPRVGAALAKRARSRVLLRPAGLTLAYTLLTVLFTWPLAAHVGSGVVSAIDPLDSIWRVGWDQERLLRAPWRLFDGKTFYPYPGSYFFDELLVGSALLTLPLRLITDNPIAIYNLAVLASFVLSGLGMYALARHLGCHLAGAFVAGLIYAFAPLHVAHFGHFSGHLGMLSGQYFPLVILLLDRSFTTPRWRDALALAAMLAMQALSSQYYAFYLVFVVGGFVLLRVVQRGLRLQFPGPGVWARLLVAGGLAALVVLPFGLGYRAVQDDHRFARALEENLFYSANVASFFIADPQNWLWGGLTAPLRAYGRYNSERNMFPGLLALALALVGALTAWRRPLAQYLVALGVGSAILALGPRLYLTADPASLVFAPLPYHYLYDYLPGFDSMRVPARIGILYGLSVAGLAGVGLSWLLARVVTLRPPRVGSRAAGALAVIAGICLESANRPYRVTPLETGERIPPVYRWLATQPAAVVVELPFLIPNRVPEQRTNLRYQYFGLHHRHTLVNGSADFVPKGYTALHHELKYGPTPRALSILQGLGVTHIVVHYDHLQESFGARIAGLTRQSLTTSERVREEARFGADVVYRLAASEHLAQLRATIPRDATIYLSREDRLGSYGAMIARVLRENRIYTRVRVEFGQRYAGLPQPGARYDYAVLYHQEDPATVGFAGAEVVWQDEVVRVYRRPDP